MTADPNRLLTSAMVVAFVLLLVFGWWLWRAPGPPAVEPTATPTVRVVIATAPPTVTPTATATLAPSAAVVPVRVLETPEPTATSTVEPTATATRKPIQRG